MIIDERCKRICSILMQETEFIPLGTLSELLNISERTLYSDLETLDQIFIEHQIEPIVRIRAEGIKINATHRNFIHIHQLHQLHIHELSQAARAHVLACAILSGRFHSIEALQTLCQISRNTVFNELKIMRFDFQTYDLELEYRNHVGYTVVGQPLTIRSLFMHHTLELLNTLSIDVQSEIYGLDHAICDIFSRLKQIEAALHTEYVEGTLEGITMLLSLVLEGSFEAIQMTQVPKIVVSSEELKLIQQHFPQLDHQEAMYFAIHLLGARTQILVQNKHIGRYITLAIEVVRRFEMIAAVPIHQISRLIRQLSNHLAISHMRYEFGLHHNNALLQEIKSRFPEIFYATDQALDIVRASLRVPISEGEVAYVTLHLNNFIVQPDVSQHDVRVLVVCPQGMSTSYLLKQEIETLSNQVTVVDLVSVNAFYDQVPETSYDYIVSTVHLETQKPMIKVDPVPTTLQRQRMIRQLGVHQSPIDMLFERLKPYIAKADYHVTYQIIRQSLNLDTQSNEKGEKTRLLDVLHEDYVLVETQFKSIEAALAVAASPLLRSHVIEECYVHAMFESLHKYGAYAVIEGGYLLAHASFEQGVNYLGVSFMKCEPMLFDGKMVDKVCVLATVDHQSHLGIMKDLLILFGDEAFLEAVDRAKNSTEIRDAMRGVLEFQS